MKQRSDVEEREFETLVLEHLEAVQAFSRRLTHQAHDAEDLAHDALVRAVRFRHRFRPGTNMKAWLFRIVRNTFINRWRAQRRRPAVQLGPEDLEYVAQARDDRGDWLDGPARDPFTAARDREMLADVRTALGELSETYRHVVDCCLVQGLSYREAADRLRVPPGTVMSRLHRGRKQLQERLRHHAVERGWAA